MLQIRRTFFYKLGLMFLAIVQINIVRSDVKEALTLALIKKATIKDIIDALVEHTNDLAKLLSPLDEKQQKEVAKTLRAQHPEMFAGYFYHNQSLGDFEYESLISGFKIVPTGNWLKSCFYSMPYNLINITTDEIIDQSYGWTTYAFSHDEARVVHAIQQEKKMIVISTRSKQQWEIPYPNDEFVVNNLAFTHDKNFLIITSHYHDNQIYVYDLRQGRYCTPDEFSFGAKLLLTWRDFFSKVTSEEHVLLSKIPAITRKIHAATSPCGSYILFMVENNADDSESTIGIYLYRIEEDTLQEVCGMQHPSIDELPLVEYSDLPLDVSIHKVCKPKKLSGTFSKDGNFFAIRCQFNVEDHIGENAMVLDERYKPSIIAIFESASGKSCFETEIDECKNPISFFKLNEDGSKLIANIEAPKQMIWQYMDLNKVEPDFNLNKTLLVYMFAKWYKEHGQITLHTVDSLFDLLEQFTFESQWFLKQKYNIKPMTHFSRFVDNVSHYASKCSIQ